MPYVVIAHAFEKMENTTKRLEKIEIMSNLFRSVISLRSEELVYVTYLCANRIAPPYAGLELGVGDQVIMKALTESTGRHLKDLKQDLIKHGDLGIVAMMSRNKQRTMFKPKPLTVKSVFDTFIQVFVCLFFFFIHFFYFYFYSNICVCVCVCVVLLFWFFWVFFFYGLRNCVTNVNFFLVDFVTWK